MTVPTKSATKGTKLATTKKIATVKPTAKKAKPVLSARVRQGVEQTFEWFKSQPSSWDRLERAVSLLDCLTSRSESDFVEALLNAYEGDNHHHRLKDELIRIGTITKSAAFAAIADQLTSL